MQSFSVPFALSQRSCWAAVGSRLQEPRGQGDFGAGGFTGGMCSSRGIPLLMLMPNLSRYPMCTSSLLQPHSFTAGKENLEVFIWISLGGVSHRGPPVSLPLVGIALFKTPEEERSVHKYLPKTNVKFSASWRLLKALPRRSATEISARGGEGTSSALPAGPTLPTHQILTRCRALGVVS